LNILSGFGGAAKNLTIRFLADTARATQAIDRLLNKIRQAMIMSSGLSSASVSRMAMAGGGGIFGRTFQGYALRPGGLPIVSGAGAKLPQEAGKAVKGMNTALSRTVLGATRAKTAFSALGGVLQAIPGWAKGAIVGLFLFREAFKHGMMVESAKMVMEVLTGSETRASSLVTAARKYSIRTLFKPEEVLGATTTAIQRGIDPYKKGAYGLAKNKTAMDIFSGLGSMINPLTGKVLGVNRMAEAILRGDYRLLRPVRGIINPAYEAAQKSGYKVGTPGFNIKFIEELGKIPQIMELAKRQSETIQGLWSTISGLWQEFWMDFTGAEKDRGVLTFWSQIRDIMLEVRNAILPAYEKLQPFLTEIGAMVGSVIRFLYTTLKTVFTVIKPILGPTLAILRTFTQVLIFIFQNLTKGLEMATWLINKIFKFLGINSIMNKLSEFITGLQMYIQFWGIYIDYVFEKLRNNIDKLFEKLEKLKPFLKLLGHTFSGDLTAYISTEIAEKTGINKLDKVVQDWFDKRLQEAKDVFKEDWKAYLEEREEQKWGTGQKEDSALLQNLRSLTNVVDKLNRKLDEEKVEIQKRKKRDKDITGNPEPEGSW